MISVVVNGEPRRFEAPLSCERLIGVLELAGKRIALEKNGDIIPRSRYGAEMVNEGDRLEIVVAVGGG